MRHFPTLLAATAALALSACASTPGPSDVQVTRFASSDIRPFDASSLATRNATSETAVSGLAFAQYENAVADELAGLGFTVNPANRAQRTATITVEKYRIDSAGRRSPVSVGVGGSTGRYGRGGGVGAGVGIDLTGLLGGGPKDRIGTRLSVAIDGNDGARLWEGRAEYDAAEGSEAASDAVAAERLAAALFAGFPGESGETIVVE